jgi:adenylate cyclase
MLDKYMGDCAMLAFGVPEPDDDHAFHAITCALVIQRLIAEENQQRERRGEPTVHFRLALNSGRMLAGNMGSAERMQYTVVGDSVNLASRLCTIGDADQIIITEEMLQRPGIRDRVIARRYESIRLRGIRRPVTTWLVEDLAPAYRDQLARQVRSLWWQVHRHTA